MKFYNRANELAELQRIQNLSFSDHSRLTVITGRRRIGKTSLIMKSVEDLPRADNIIKLPAFDLTTLKEIMRDYNPDYTPDDLLALYTFTGGVPKYVELFCDNITLNIEEMRSETAKEKFQA
jgi:predicted YcjX-like family ATPase